MCYRSQGLGKTHRAQLQVDRFEARYGELRGRPKGMRRATYRRLSARLNELYARWDYAMNAELSRLLMTAKAQDILECCSEP